MDRPISQSEQSKGKLKSFLPYILVIGILALAYLGLRKVLTKSGDARDFHIVKVEKGDIKNTLSASGLVVASSERVINSPVTTEIEKVMLISGTEVKKGDVILQLDKEYTKLEYDKLQDELSLRKNNIDKLKLEFDKNLRDLDYSDQIKALQLDELEAGLKDQKRLLEVGGATKEEVEAAELKLKISKIEKQKIENELAYRRSVNETEKANLQLEYDIQSKRLHELRKKLAETRVQAPEAGVITWINEDIGKTVAEGEPLVKIANLSRYKVEGSTSDRNSKTLQVGLPVEVRLGKDRLAGTITRILPEITNNTVRFDVTLDDASHAQLRPNLRTELYIVTDKKENVLRAKRGAALKGSQSQFFYKVNNGQATKVRVKKGLVSSDYFEVQEGLSPGDRIIISDVSDFEHLESFTIKGK